ncbi:MAG TPA: (deoxy)nucleoside triphosphate pyrophosphohydrolase [Deltaproteobacteria bacterium]|nr:(deoxy)nucleoside triphosphate pyrophosphohydrolase [Deltaproteobacteria bacterium]
MTEKNEPKLVTAALICSNNKILITQRPPDKLFPLQWEFPGGKVEPSEDPEDCLIRELKEELDVDIEVVDPFITVNHRYPEFYISLMTFWCKIKGGKIRLLEHSDYKWVELEELTSYDFVEADAILIKKIIEKGIPEKLSARS